VTQIEPTPDNDTPAHLHAVETTAPNPAAEPQTLAERVMAAQQRLAERTAPARASAGKQATAAAGAAKKFVTDHPVLAVTGAVVAGAAIAFALPGRSGKKLRGGAMAVGGLVAELAATYGTRMLAMAEEAAEASQEKLGEIGESFAAAGENIADNATATGATVVESVRNAGEAATSQAKSLARKLKR